MIIDNSQSHIINLDFEQARVNHLLFKSKLRSVLYGIEMEDTTVVSHFECAVGKWIYSDALQDYGHIPEMHELEKVHAEIHTSARHLIQLYKDGNVEKARSGLETMEKIADHLIQLLSVVEDKLEESPSPDHSPHASEGFADTNLKELYKLQQANQELDIRIRDQSRELYKSKERFDLVAKATQDAVWDWDLVTNDIWWNDGFKELFGYTEDEILPGLDSWYTGIHPEDRDRVVDGIHAVIDKGGKNWSDEYRFKRSNGNYAIIFDRGYALHDAEGKPYRMVGSMQDITEEKQSKEALHRAQVQLEAALSAGLVSTYFWDIKKDLVYADNTLAMLFSLTPEEAQAGLPLKRTVKAIHRDDVDRVMKLVTRAVDTGEDYAADYRVTNAAGECRWVASRGKVNYDKEGKPVSFPGTLSDITDRKKTEEALAKSEEQFRHFGNNIDNPAWIADLTGRVSWYNQRWFDYTGTDLEEMQGPGREKVHHPEHTERVAAFVEKARKKAEPWELIFPLRRNDGIYRWFLTRCVPVKDSEGKVYQWIGTNTDINDKVEIEQELENRVTERTKALQETNQMLERSNSELEQYAYVTSHDLQEPLRKIQIFNNLLLERHGDELTDNAKKYIGKVSDSAIRMNGLIRDLLKFSRLSEKAIHFEDVDLNIILADVLNDLEILKEQKEATVRSAHLPVIQAVSLQINQLFFNLINNSLKFTRDNIAPVIDINFKKLTELRRTQYDGLNADSEYYEFVFKDNGIGFNQAYTDKIFTVFQRLNDRSIFGGYGIGLAICEKVVLNHKGIIFAEGKEGEGASFTVILPIKQIK